MMQKIRLKKDDALSLLNANKLPTIIGNSEHVKIFTHKRPSVEPPKNQLTQSPQDLPHFDNEFCDVAFLSNAYPYYCGGRYYDFILYLMLLELGYSTILYTNLSPNFGQDFFHYKEPKVKIVNTRAVTLPCANSYFGAPLSGALRAIELGAHYHKPVRISVYDCPEWLINNKYIGEYHARYELMRYIELRHLIHSSLGDIPDFKIFALTENSIEAWANWLNLDPSYITYINPSINNRQADMLGLPLPKKPWVVSISRNDFRKGWSEVFECFQKHADDYTLHVVTNYLDNMKEELDRLRVPHWAVKFHQGISDFLKFSLIAQSKVMLSASHFEGFGIWAVEALKVGTPVVCYDLESFKEIEHSGLHKVPIHDTEALSAKLDQVLAEESTYHLPLNAYDFDVQKLKFRERFILPAKTLDRFDEIQKPNYKTIITTFNTNPIVYHFNSIYKQEVAKQSKENHIAWRNLISHVWYNKPYEYDDSLNDRLTILTFSTHPRQTILEACCAHLNIPLRVFRPQIIGKWKHNDRIKFTVDALQQIDTPFVLHVDAEDALIVGDPHSLFRLYEKSQFKILYAAEETCHPESDVIAQQQVALCKNGKTPFKYLNAGIFFGETDYVRQTFVEASKLSSYPTDNPGDRNSDQGKHNQLYIKHFPDIMIDNGCEVFYCNDYNTDTSKFLRTI